MMVLPGVADDQDGLWLFGAAAAAPLISLVVATSVAGLRSDRRGPGEAQPTCSSSRSAASAMSVRWCEPSSATWSTAS
jgi:hypothetical protein